MKKEEVIRLLRENMEEIKKFGVKRIGIFGSVVRGEADEESDIDLIVEFEEGKKSFDNFINLCFFLEKVLGKNVEVITPEALSPYIKPYIESEVVYEKL